MHACVKYDSIILYHTMQSRITITIPAELIEAADARAKDLDRSRSWVLVEALRRYLGGPGRGLAVHEAAAHPYEAGSTGVAGPVDAAAEVAESRRLRLRAELALDPLERLQRAEELARLGQATIGCLASAQVLGFDSYDDYYEWKRKRLIRL